MSTRAKDASAVEARSLVVEIDELVLHGVSRRDAPAVTEAIRAEIARVFADAGVPGRLARDAQIERLDAGEIRTNRAATPRALGGAVAGAVTRSLGAPAPRRR